MSKRKWWVSWWTGEKQGAFELHSPWWVTGQRGSENDRSICAAVLADSEDEAKRKVLSSYDRPAVCLEWRFVGQKTDDWSPFSERFPRADWMVWP